ncbi:uncharacterized protein [Struthio camelus]|uniref:uncharacterized protein n=1 Tax=Struthio camelus TaxID=8801 RepID=UPI003604282E
MPELRDSVLSGTKTAASLTVCGRAIVFPEYKLASVVRKPRVKPVAPVKPTWEEERRKADSRGKQGNLPANHLLFREQPPPPRIPALNMDKGKGDTGKGKAPPGSVLPAIRGSSSRKVEKGRRKQSAEARLPAVSPLSKSQERAGQVQQRSETQSRVQSGSSLAPAGKEEESAGKLREEKPSFQDVLQYCLAPDEDVTINVLFSRGE